VKKRKKKCIVVLAVNKEIFKKDIREFLNVLNFKNIIEIPKEFWKYLIWKDTLYRHRAVFIKNFLREEKKEKFRNNLQSFNVCILHVGMHKTGSTSIQLTLNNYENNKFYYAKLSPDGCHNIPICILYSKNLYKHPYFRHFSKEEIKENREKAQALLIKNVLASGGKNLIISAEHILLLKYEELQNLKNFLDYYFKRILIYAYVREPFGYLSSIFQQNLKYLNIKIEQLPRWYPNYKKTFQKFYKIFGEKNIILKKFAPERFPDGCVVKDFCQTLGISISKHRVIRANISWPKEVVSFIYILRKFEKNINIHPWQIQFLVELLFEEILKDVNLNPFKLSKKLIKPIIEKNRDDIRWIEGKLGEPLIEESLLEEEEEDYVIESEEDLLNIPPEVVERLRDYTNYSDNNKPLQFQVAEMLLNILADNFPDIKAQIEN